MYSYNVRKRYVNKLIERVKLINSNIIVAPFCYYHLIAFIYNKESCTILPVNKIKKISDYTLKKIIFYLINYKKIKNGIPYIVMLENEKCGIQ